MSKKKKVDIEKLRDATKDREKSDAVVKPVTSFRSILTLVK